MVIDFSAFESALASLEEALASAPRNDVERDGVIQRFEYTFELAWKTARKVLEENGITSNSPKSVIRDMSQQGWIHEPDLWLSFLRARNATTHTYKKTTAEEVYSVARKFAPKCRELLTELKKR